MILAGGASRRMGGALKGLETVGGARIIDRVAEALQSATDRLLIASNDPAAPGWLAGVPVVGDVHPGTGGMAGVEAALQTASEVLVVAWDMPFVPPALLRELARQAATFEADVVVPESDSPHGFEPFCAYYNARVLPGLSDFLSHGGGAAREYVARVERVQRVPLRDVARFGDVATAFFSVNSRVDLERARTIAEAAR